MIAAADEVQRAIDLLRYFGGTAGEVRGETVPLGDGPFNFTTREPVGAGWEAAREEIFGPVQVAIPWRSEDEVIAMANDSGYGLAGYVWSHDIDAALCTANRIESGWVQVTHRKTTTVAIRP